MDDLETIAGKIASLPHDENEFVSPQYEQDDFPVFFDAVREGVKRLGFELSSGREFDSGVRVGKFELQTHSVSVHEHTDDVVSPSYFGIVVLNTTTRGIKYAYDSRATFTGYGVKGKYKRELEFGRLMVFNPRKPHSLTYYGEVATLALFSVRPIRGVTPWWVPVTYII